MGWCSRGLQAPVLGNAELPFLGAAKKLPTQTGLGSGTKFWVFLVSFS